MTAAPLNLKPVEQERLVAIQLLPDGYVMNQKAGQAPRYTFSGHNWVPPGSDGPPPRVGPSKAASTATAAKRDSIVAPQAIETSYDGYVFRSRLEARWAFVLNAVAARWSCEPEGFELPSGRYLPDFLIYLRPGHWRLPEHPCGGYWLEIKGVPPSKRELDLLAELAVGTRRHAYLFAGDIENADVYKASLESGAVERSALGPVSSAIFSDTVKAPVWPEKLNGITRAAARQRFSPWGRS